MIPNNISPVGNKKPSWWSPKMGLLFVLGFGVVAAWPFLSSTGRLLAAGEDVSVERVMKTAKMEMQKKEKMEPGKYREIKAYLAVNQGGGWLGTKGGMFKQKDGAWTYDADFPGGDVKALGLAPDGTVWAAAKEGVFSRTAGEAGKWQEEYGKEVHSLTVGDDGVIYAAGKFGVVRRIALGQWEPVLTSLPENALPAEVVGKMQEEKMKGGKLKEKHSGEYHQAEEDR